MISGTTVIVIPIRGSHESNVFTGGVGFAPLDLVHIDLIGLYGEGEAWGAGVLLGMSFMIEPCGRTASTRARVYAIVATLF